MRNSYRWVAAISLAFLFLLLFWVSTEGMDSSAGPGLSLGNLSALESASAIPDAVITDAPVVPIKREIGSIADTPVTGTAEFDVESHEGFDLLILRNAKNQEPVIGASVWSYLFPYDRPKVEVEKFRLLHAGPEELGRRFAQELLSDAQGRVWIPHTKLASTVVARKGELFGYTPNFFPEDRILFMAPDQSLDILVVDFAGNPLAGIPIGLNMVQAESSEFLRDATTLSDPDGIAHIRHLQAWKSLYRADSLRIQPKILLHDPPFLALFDSPDSGFGPTFRLPALGHVVVKVVDSLDHPVLGSSVAFLMEDLQPEQTKLSGGVVPEHLPLNTIEGFLDDGRVHFPWVETNLDLSAWVPQAEPTQSTLAFGRSPWKEGDSVTLTARPLELATILAMQVVEESGAVLANASLSILFNSRDKWMPQKDGFTTDADGRLEISLTRAQKITLGSGPRTLEIRLIDPAEGQPRMGLVTVPNLHFGRNDLGRVLLDGQHLLAAGVLLGESGEGLPGLTVYLDRTPHNGERDYFLDNSDAEGRFFFFGESSQQEITISVDEGDFIPYRELIPRGSYGLSIHLRRGKQLFGSVVIPEGFQAEDFAVRFVPEAKGQEPFVVNIQGDDTFILRGLSSESGSLHFFIGDSNTNLLELPNVKPHSATEVQDSRLKQVDLRHLLRTVSLCVKDENGLAISGARVQGMDPGQMEFGDEVDEQGCIQVHVPLMGMRVWVYAQGFVPQLVSLKESPVTVRLEPGFDLHLQLSEVPSGNENLTFHMQLQRPLSAPMGVLFTSWVTLDEEGMASLRVPGAGKYGVALYVKREGQYLGYLYPWSPSNPEFTVNVLIGQMSPMLIPFPDERLEALLRK